MEIGIFGAEKQEISFLKNNFNYNAIKIAGITFYKGRISEHNVVLACSGIGKVNAALCCQILISEFNVNMIINTGTAGGLDDKLNTFDIAVSTESVQHDVDATAFGYAKGQIPGTKSAYWTADKKLRKIAVTAFEIVKNELKIEGIKLLEGRIASGDAFISENKVREKIIQTFNPLCAEMEGAAAAQVCVLNKIPYLILRSISDNAGKQNSAKISYEEFSKQAAKNSAKIVLKMITLI